MRRTGFFSVAFASTIFSGPTSPFSPGTLPGQSLWVCGSSADARTMHIEKAINVKMDRIAVPKMELFIDGQDFKTLVPRLCLGMHCPTGSCRSYLTPLKLQCRAAEPPSQCIPRQSLGTSF